MPLSSQNHTEKLCPLPCAKYQGKISIRWDMHMEAKILNHTTLFTLIMLYKSSSPKSVIPFTLLSASFFTCRRSQGRRGVAAGQTEVAYFAMNCDPQILSIICGKEQLLYLRTILLVFSINKEIIKGFFP